MINKEIHKDQARSQNCHSAMESTGLCVRIAQVESLPVINELGKWIFEQIKSMLPKSQIGKAMQYSYNRWDALSAYLHDGNLLIDNNQIENSIRGLALGRKNYLFAGSHEAAHRAAMIYSFFFCDLQKT